MFSITRLTFGYLVLSIPGNVLVFEGTVRDLAFLALKRHGYFGSGILLGFCLNRTDVLRVVTCHFMGADECMHACVSCVQPVHPFKTAPTSLATKYLKLVRGDFTVIDYSSKNVHPFRTHPAELIHNFGDYEQR